MCAKLYRKLSTFGRNTSRRQQYVGQNLACISKIENLEIQVFPFFRHKTHLLGIPLCVFWSLTHPVQSVVSASTELRYLVAIYGGIWDIVITVFINKMSCQMPSEHGKTGRRRSHETEEIVLLLTRLLVHTHFRTRQFRQATTTRSEHHPHHPPRFVWWSIQLHRREKRTLKIF